MIGASAAEQRRRAGELLVEVGDLLRDDAGRPVEVAQGGGALGDEHHHPVGVLAELRLQLLGVSELVAQVVAFAQQRLLARPDGAAQPLHLVGDVLRAPDAVHRLVEALR